MLYAKHTNIMKLIVISNRVVFTDLYNKKINNPFACYGHDLCRLYRINRLCAEPNSHNNLIEIYVL